MRLLTMLFLVGCPASVPEPTDEPVGTASDSDSETETETEPVDIDEDGYDTSVDCNDFNPDIHPGAAESWNGEDDNCDGREDADGHYDGTAAIQFRVVVEGRRYRWDLECPAKLNRTGWQLDFEVRCEPPDDPVALQTMGAWFTITERDNIASDGLWSGATVVESADGWTVAGTGHLTWSGFDDVSGELAMRSTFAQLDGPVTLSWTN